ncbi:Zinc finger protein [Wickerhamomyces ciferrii]|uniref:Zinc finger protein n=1 Tax=Wickerhamomyces ciferrii (strain ATCC 14091 / BCRC 22168 / CBS 111 / JCM 3599 / NBRC 0793 / NRRL Y-1031 F-60-10) TaxID=1206466 RepID=K0KST3_WICCF|nr:Zinc finger protein [Wickerhamomyces ciferrii]CCH44388.1 Zinc finger protein [Wickerhamomyces ciferrii]
MNEPKTPTLTLKSNKSSNKSTPNKSYSKWAKFQEKFHSYSNKSQQQSQQQPQSQLNSANSINSFQYSPHNLPYTSSTSNSSFQSFENPQDYLKNLSIDDYSLSNGLKSTPNSLNSNSNLTLPSRSSSLPKSNEILLPDYSKNSSNLTLNNDSTLVSTSQQQQQQSHQTPPKVKPFIYSQNSTPQRSKKTLINEKCCFCDELLSSKFSTDEKIISLTCGDTCHEECLWTFIDENENNQSNDWKSNTDPKKFFPNCDKCNKLAIPLDESITDSIISKILLNSSPPKNQNNDITTSSSSDSLIISSNYKSPLHQQQQHSTKSHKYQSLSLSNSRNQKDLSIQIPNLSNPSNSRHYSRPPSNLPHIKSNSRGSSISAMSSIISSVSRSPSPNHTDTFMSLNTNNTTTKESNKIPLAILRSEYISQLIKKLNQFSTQGITESEIDSFGYLRLVDNLLVSSNGENFTNYIVYLFQFNLILIEENYTNWEKFKLLKKPQISTPTSSILKIQLNNGLKSLYFSQKSNKILQKWIAGLCDYEFIFNSDNLSSTIHISISSSPINNQNQWKPVAPQSLNVLDPTLKKSNNKDEMTIPVLLSPIKFDDLNTPIVESPTETFFKKTNNLIILIDHENQLNGSIKITLINILKVLNFKFNQIYCICSSEQFGNIYKYGDINQVISSIGTPIPQTSPKPNINQLITQLTNQNSEKFGLLIISNNLSKKSLKQLPLANQLILQIQNYNNSNNGKLTSRENLIKLDSWDKIMEILINKYSISFDDDSDDDEEDSDIDSINSDFNSDIEPQEPQEEDKESINLQDTDLDTSDEEDYDYDSDVDVNIQINPSIIQNDINSEHSEQSLNFDSNSSSSKSEISPISEIDEQQQHTTNSLNNDKNQSNLNPIKNTKSRWSSLFKDIDDALLETMETK